MKCTVKAAEQYLSSILVRNMYLNLIKRKIGTAEVESAARRVLGAGVPRQSSEVVRILRIRVSSIEKKSRELKFKWHQETKNMLI